MAVFSASVFLTTLIKTYVWQQYKFQAVSCLNSPSVGTDCTEIYACSKIPSIDSVFVKSNGVYGYTDFFYYYSVIDFWGYGRSNLTTLRPRFANMSAQAAYSVCAANDTCYAYYQMSPAAANTAILNLMTSNLNKIIALLPTDNSLVWYPSLEYASAMSVYTVLPSYDTEVYGTHNAGVLGIENGKINGTKYQEALQLSVLLGGGASMDVSEPVDIFKVGLAAKRADLEKFKSLREPERSQVWSMTMSKYKAVMQEATLHKRTCAASAEIQSASDSFADAGKVCALVQSAYGLFSFSKNLRAISKSVFIPLITLPETAFGIENTMIAIMGYVCSFDKGQGPCYPSVAPWFDPGTAQGFALTALGIAADIAAGDVPGGAIDVSCAVAGLAANAFNQAAQCCAQNCNSPKCSAAGILCAWNNAPC